jgi:Domain of unknown function (DUF5753)
MLRMGQVTLIPGLFQTPGYARAMPAARPHATDDEVENLLAARLARQEILGQDSPPIIYAEDSDAAVAVFLTTWPTGRCPRMTR